MKSKTSTKLVYFIGLAIVALGMLAIVVFSVVNASVVTGVTVSFVGDASRSDEPTDMTLNPLSEERLPDYRVDLVVDGETRKLGTMPNRSAVDGLEFRVAGEYPVRQLQEIVLMEDDPVKNDVLVRVQGQQPFPIESGGYKFELEQSRSFMGGLEYFFATPIGKAVLTGITIAVILLVITFVMALLGG